MALVEYNKTHKLAVVQLTAWVDSYMGVWNVKVRPANVELPDSLAHLQQRLVPVREQSFTTDWLV